MARQHKNRKKSEAPGVEAPPLISSNSFAKRISFPAAILLAAWIVCVAIFFYFKGRIISPDIWINFFSVLPHIHSILSGGLFWNIILCMAIWVVFYGLGSSVLTPFRFGGVNSLERMVITVALGSGTLSVLLLILGLLGLWAESILRSLFFTGLAASLGSIVYRQWYNPVVHKKQSNSSDAGILQYVALAVIALAVLMNVLASDAPEIFYDALLYHLALPKLYLLRGGIVPTPENLYSGIPFNMEMLYGLALSISNGRLPSLLSCSFGLMVMLAIWVVMRRYTSSRPAAILALLLFYLCPPVLLESWEGAVDIGAGFYVIVAFIALSFSLDTPTTGNSKGWAILAGGLMGFACGVKYTLLPFGILFLLVHYWLRRRDGKDARETIYMGAVLLIAFSPWLLKNLWFYGNPVYPFFSKLFRSSEPALFTAFLQDARLRDLIHTFTTVEGWKSFFIHPWNIAIGNRGVDDWLGAPILILAPWILFLRWGIRQKSHEVPRGLTALGVLAVLGYSLWYLTSDIVRFLIPSLPLIVCAIALAVESSKFRGWLWRVAWVGGIFFSLFNFQTICRLGETWAMGKWGVLSGRGSYAAYLADDHMSYDGSYYPAMEYINNELPANARVLFLGESRAYYCNRDFIASSVFDENPFWSAVRGSKTAEELYSRVNAMGITHIFVSITALYTYAYMPTVTPHDLIGGKVFGDFVGSYLDIIFNEKRISNDSGLTRSRLLVYKITDQKHSFNPLAKNPFEILLDNIARKNR